MFFLFCKRENGGSTKVVGWVLFSLFEHQNDEENWIAGFWVPWSHDSSAGPPESLCPSLLIFFSLSPLISVRQFCHCNLTTGSCSLSISVPLAILYPNIKLPSRESGVLGNHAGPFEYDEGSSLAFSAFWQKNRSPKVYFSAACQETTSQHVTTKKIRMSWHKRSLNQFGFLGFGNNNVISMSRKITSWEVWPRRETTAQLSCLHLAPSLWNNVLRDPQVLLRGCFTERLG